MKRVAKRKIRAKKKVPSVLVRLPELCKKIGPHWYSICELESITGPTEKLIDVTFYDGAQYRFPSLGTGEVIFECINIVSGYPTLDDSDARYLHCFKIRFFGTDPKFSDPVKEISFDAYLVRSAARALREEQQARANLILRVTTVNFRTIDFLEDDYVRWEEKTKAKPRTKRKTKR